MEPDERGPPDYDSSSEDMRVLANVIANAIRSIKPSVQYAEAPKANGVKAVIIACTATLLAAFVIGGWKLSNDSAALRAEFNEWKTAMNEWKVATERRLERLERRP